MAGGLPPTILEVSPLGDSATAEVTAVGDDALVVGTITDGEAPNVDAVTVPISRNIDRSALVSTGVTTVADDTSTSFGAVDEEIDLVMSVSTDNTGGVGHRHRDLQRLGERSVAKEHLGEATLSKHQLGVVNGASTGSVTVYAFPVLLHEDVTFGHFSRASHLLEAHTNGIQEGASQTSDGSEARANQLLCSSVSVSGATLVSAHNRKTFPERTHHGSHFSDEAVEDTNLNFTHSFKSFWLVK